MLTETKKSGFLAIIAFITIAWLTLIEQPEISGAQEGRPSGKKSVFCSGVSEAPPDECGVLVALYQKTGGKGWTNNDGWLKKSNPCDWNGVKCSNRHVGKLLLYNNNLVGDIPHELSGLTELEELDLSGNRLTGKMPSELGALKKLKYLDLSDNRFAGEIPAEFGGLAKLESLNLTDNQLTGEMPPELGALTNLKRIDLSSNRISGEMPRELGLLKKLETLYLWANCLSGTIPGEIAGLHNLKFMNIAYNGLETYDDQTVNFLLSWDYDWENTQTKLPTDIKASLTDDGKIKLTWKPIPYTRDRGGYIISYAMSPKGPYLAHGKTADKKAKEYIIESVEGASPVRCFYVIQSHTPPHKLYGMSGKQQNEVLSQYSFPIALENTHYIDVKIIPPDKGNMVEGGGNYFPEASTILKASPAPGYSFVKWGGDASGSENPLKIPFIDETQNIEANFAIIKPKTIKTKTLRISTGAKPKKGGTVKGGGKYKKGSRAKLRAVASHGYYFVKWSGAASGNANPLNVKVNGPKKIIAIFDSFVASQN